MPSCDGLDLSGNDLTELTFVDFPDGLDMRHWLACLPQAPLRRLTLQRCGNSLTWRQLKSVFHGLPHLEYLKLEAVLDTDTFERAGTELWGGLPNLRELYLKYLTVPLGEFLRPGGFSGLHSLRILDIERQDTDNAILRFRTIGNESAVLQAGTFDGLEKLTTLRLVRNSAITVIEPGAFRALTNLQQLELKKELIQKLDKGMMQGLSRLKSFDLDSHRSANQGPAWSFNGCLSSLAADTFSGSPGLERLALSTTCLEALPADLLKGLHQLKHFFVDRGYFDLLAPTFFADTTNLESLYIAKTPIGNAIFDAIRHLKSLKYLKLEQTLVNRVGKDTFSASMASLEHLHLDQNMISAFDADFSHNLRAIKFMILHGNPIIAPFPAAALDQTLLPNLTSVSVPISTVAPIPCPYVPWLPTYTTGAQGIDTATVTGEYFDLSTSEMVLLPGGGTKGLFCSAEILCPFLYINPIPFDVDLRARHIESFAKDAGESWKKQLFFARVKELGFQLDKSLYPLTNEQIWGDRLDLQCYVEIGAQATKETVALPSERASYNCVPSTTAAGGEWRHVNSTLRLDQLNCSAPP